MSPAPVRPQQSPDTEAAPASAGRSQRARVLPRTATGAATIRRSRWWMPLSAGLAFSLLFYLAFPPVKVWPFTFAAVGALVWAACRGADRPSRTGLLAGLGTLPFWFAEEAWMVRVTPLGYPLLAMYLAAWTGVAVWLMALLRIGAWRLPMAVLAPAAWVAIEVLRGEIVLTGYAWFLAAHPLVDAPALAAPAALLGTYFVGFLAVALVGAFADAAGWSGAPRRVGGLAAGVVVLAWAAASMGVRIGLPKSPESIRIGVVQTNVPQGRKMAWTAERITSDFRSFLGMTRALTMARPEPALVVWPETMFPGVSLNPRAVEVFDAVSRDGRPASDADRPTLNAAMVQTLREVQRESGVPFLIGSDEAEGTRLERNAAGEAEFKYDAKYNSAVLIYGGLVLDERYDKIDLTPFGEVIPFVWRWPSIERAVLNLGAAGMKFELEPGKHVAPLTIPGARRSDGRPIAAATPICFEVTRTTLCRRLAYDQQTGKRRADLLINLSNDGWFGDRGGIVSADAGRRQHLLAARWRCIELGVPMVRAVNTGISAYIGPRGRVLDHRVVVGDEAPVRVEAALLGEVPLPGGPAGAGTLYGRIGNLFGWLVMFATAGLLALVLWRRWTGRAAIVTTP